MKIRCVIMFDQYSILKIAWIIIKIVIFNANFGTVKK